MPEVNVGVDTARPKISEAETLFRRLVLQPSAARRRLLEDQTFDDPELCRLLLEEVSDRVFHDPADALDLAGLACEVAKRLGDATWIFLARLDLANALRIRGELKLSEEEIRQVEPMLARLPRQPLFEGRVCQVKASLATDRHQFARALELAERALGFFRSAGEPRWICEALVGKGHILAQAELVGTYQKKR